jgi:hypothetical protein
LGLVLRIDARESVCGDLLEEYRDARIPRLGRRRGSALGLTLVDTSRRRMSAK